METPQSTSLIQGWSFRILLFAMAMSCFLSVGPAVHRRLTLSMKGVPASIELDRTTQSLPSEWSTSDGWATITNGFGGVKPRTVWLSAREISRHVPPK